MKTSKRLGVLLLGLIQMLLPVGAAKYFAENTVPNYEMGDGFTTGLLIQAGIGAVWALVFVVLLFVARGLRGADRTWTLLLTIMVEAAGGWALWHFQPEFIFTNPQLIMLLWGATVVSQLGALAVLRK